MKSFAKVTAEYFLHCEIEKKLSDKTLKAYKTDLEQFHWFVASNSNSTNIEEINKLVLMEYLKDLYAKYKIKSVKRKIACVKALFNYYEFEHDAFVNPFRKIRLKIREPFIVPVVMNFAEIKCIFVKIYQIKSAEKDKNSYHYKSLLRDIALLELLFATGLRVSEVTNLKAGNINLEDGLVKVLGKGRKERIIQVCNINVIKALKEYQKAFKKEIEKNGHFFVNRLDTRLSEQSARNTVKRYASISKLNKNITPHTYRHTFATMLLEEGVDIKYIQELLGHSSINTTQIYTHVNAFKQRQILSEKHPRNKLLIGI